MSAGGACDAVMTARKKVKFRKCGESQYGKIFPLKLKEAVYKSYLRPVILNGSEA